jgi:hypothetical protein
MQSAHVEAICQTWPAPIISVAVPSPISQTPRAGEIFHKIGVGNAGGGSGDPGGDLAGSGGVLRGEDPASEPCRQERLGAERRPGLGSDTLDYPHGVL